MSPNSDNNSSIRRYEPLTPRNPNGNDRQPRTWYQSFLALKAYYDEHGDTLVPVYFKADTALGHWVQANRKLAHTLDEKQVSLLNSIGFAWSGHEGRLKRAFQRKYNQLKAFYEQHGHCDTQDKALKAWAKHQRKLYWQGNLVPERIDKLNAISFRWEYMRHNAHNVAAAAAAKPVAVQAKSLHQIKKQRLEKQHKEFATTPKNEEPSPELNQNRGDTPTNRPLTTNNQENYFQSSLEAATAAAVKASAVKTTASPRSVAPGADATFLVQDHYAPILPKPQEKKSIRNDNNTTVKTPPPTSADHMVDPSILKQCEEEWEAELEEGAMI